MFEQADPAPAVRRYRAVVALLLVWLAITGVVFGLRVASVIRARDLISATGMEAMPTYGVWKARNGFPIYEDPFRWAYPSNLYNRAFYKLYGGIVALTGMNGGDIVLPARAITFGFSVMGVVGLFLAAREVTDAKPQAGRRTVLAICAVLSLQAFYSSNFTSWWSLGIRPDVAVAALLAWAWFFLLRGLRKRAIAPFVAAGVLFYFTWCFKQTNILTLAAVALYLLVIERWYRAAIALILTAGVPIVLTALLWSRVPHYLDNVIIAPQGNVFSLRVGIEQVVAAILQNPLVFGLPILYLIFRRPGFLRRGDRLPFVVAAMLIPPTLLAVARIGGGRNYMFEIYLACTLCAAVLLARAIESGDVLGRRLLRITVPLLIVSCVFPLAQMILKDRIGRVWVPADEIARYRQLSDFLAQKAGEILVLEDMFAQPWRATGGKHPATVIDVVVYESAQKRGLIKDGGIERVITSKRYPYIVVKSNTLPYDSAVANGYFDYPMQAVNACGLRYLARDRIE